MSVTVPDSGVTISLGSISLQPELVLTFESRRESVNMLHPVIGQGSPHVTLRPAGLRRGSLEIWCSDLPTAVQIEALHAGVGVLQLVHNDLMNLSMTYVVDGSVQLTQDTQTLRWLVRVDFAEVAS